MVNGVVFLPHTKKLESGATMNHFNAAIESKLGAKIGAESKSGAKYWSQNLKFP